MHKVEQGSEISTLDLSQTYQLGLDDKSGVYTTINTHQGLHEYVHLPFGIHSAVSIFQHTMETLLADIDGCVVYIDDIIITNQTDEEHKKTLERVLQRLQKAGMRVNPEKLQLMQDNITSLGHVFSSEAVSPSSEKIKAMVDAKTPASVGELQSFIGSVNYIRKFIPNLASLLSSLYRLSKKDAVWQWNDGENQVFVSLKESLCSAEVLAY